jgi:diguanylate cyclase (GGDEF)-like protein
MSSSQAVLKASEIIRVSGPSPIRTIIAFGMRLVKRSFDISLSLIGLLFLTPVFVYIAALIKQDSTGPIFYQGPRMGRNGKTFKIIKFRTMYEDQRSYKGPSVTAQGDERITPLGHWLRDTKINELPQLWNVLIGEMSLVGPRPEDVKIAESWPEDAAAEILSVRPGITSPASILYHDEERMLSGTDYMGDYFKNILPDKMRLDRLYIRHHSFFSDIDIIFWTLAILIPSISKAHIPEGYIFAGPLTRLVRRYLSWFTLDLVIALIAVAITSLLWRISAPLNWGTSHLAVLGFLLAFLFSCVNSIFGVNKVIWSKAQSTDAYGLVVSCSIATAIILILNFLQTRFRWLPDPPLTSMMVLTVGFLAGTGFLVTRYRLRLLTAIATTWLLWRKNKVDVGERVVIVGLGEGTQIASWLVQRRMFRTAFSVVGMVDHMDPTTHGMKVNGLWMLGGINDLPTLLKKYDIGVILSTLPQNSPETEYLFSLSIIFLNDLLWIVDQQVTKPVGKTDFPLWLDERLGYKALHDDLTELPNWPLFQDRLRHSLALAKRNMTQTACMFVVLKGLHLLPDDLGRNSLLKDVAYRLNHTKREVDTLARFNDNTFALLLENVPDKSHLNLILKRISGALSTPYINKGQEIKIESNIYVSICTGSCEAAKNPKSANIKQCYECIRTHEIAINSEAIQ